MKPMDNLYILSSILSSRMKLSLPVSTNIIEILIEILKKKTTTFFFETEEKTKQEEWKTDKSFLINNIANSSFP